MATTKSLVLIILVNIIFLFTTFGISRLSNYSYQCIKIIKKRKNSFVYRLIIVKKLVC